MKSNHAHTHCSEVREMISGPQCEDDLDRETLITNPRTHTAPLYEQLNILNIFNLYILRVCAELHPHIHPSTTPRNRPEHTHHYTPITEQHEHKTRYSQEHRQYISRSTETYQARYATLWNNLPLELRREKNRKKFKTLLKHYLQSQQDLIQ